MRYQVRGLTLLLFQRLFDAIGQRGGLRIVLLFGRVLSGCTPAFAEPYRIERTGDLWNRLSVLIYAAALVQCLVLTGALSLLNGNFLPAPGVSIEFLEDRWNLFLYALVCPLYVTLCVRLVLLAVERDGPSDIAIPTCSVSSQVRRVFLSLFLICLLSSILITNYVNDALDPRLVGHTYWFAEEWHGDRRLNSAGLYYIVLNFMLLFTTFLGGAAFISVSIDGIRLARSLLDSNQEIDFKTYRQRLDRLVTAYYWGVLLVACYAVNIIVWKHSPLGGTANIHLAGAMLTVLGIFFVTVPRRFIEHAWASYCVRKRNATDKDDVIEHQEVVPANKGRNIALIEWACILGWFPNFYGLTQFTQQYLDPYRWIEVIFKSP